MGGQDGSSGASNSSLCSASDVLTLRRYFRDQPLLHPDRTDSHLLIWYFEDWLKKYFFSMLQILETFSLDPLPYVRTQTLAFLATLLRSQPEQEQNLLRLLVNKLVRQLPLKFTSYGALML